MLKKFKHLLAILVMSFVLVNSYCQTPDFTGLKIMVNPGHGGHDSNDRYQAATGFWESEGNLTKGLWLRDLLEARGAEVIMSRVLNRTEDDLPLSQIVALANDNDCDLHISIHSNAGNQSTNYPLTLFNGKSETPSIPAAKEWARILWEQLITNETSFWTSVSPHYIGDLTFRPDFTYGYGVIYGLTVPGIISEGSFHDYLPEQQRLCNLDYRKQEAYNILYAMETYFELTGTEATGHISGIVRDSLLVKANYNIANSPDKFMNVNGTLATLVETGEEYIIDDLNTGFYMFDSLVAGTYKVVFSAENYFNDTVTLNVTAHEFTYHNQWMKADKTMPPQVLSTNPSDGDNIECFDPIHFTFNMNMDSASVATAFQISPAIAGTFIWDEDYLNMEFQADIPYEVSTAYNVTLANTAEHQWGVPMEAPVTFSFNTGTRNRYNLLLSFPANDQNEVSPLLQFRLIFDAAINNSSLIDAVEIEAEDAKIIKTKGAKISEIDGEGHYYFLPAEPLAYDASYTLRLSGSIADAYNIPLVDEISIPFTTMEEPINLVILDEFDQINGVGWVMDYTDNNSIDLSTILYHWKKGMVSGEATKMLKYNFLQAGGFCTIYPDTAISLIDDSDKIAMWVSGEMSDNKLIIGFDNEAEVELCTIDFAGWNYCSAELPEDVQSIAYIRLEQGTSGAAAGEIFLDMLNQRDHTGISSTKVNRLSVYPNPYTGNEIFIQSLPNSTSYYEIYKLSGALLQKGELQNGDSRLQLDDKVLKTQAFILKITNDQFSKSALISKK